MPFSSMAIKRIQVWPTRALHKHVRLSGPGLTRNTPSAIAAVSTWSRLVTTRSAPAAWIDELVRMPRRRQRSGLRLAVADNARDDKVRVVECRAISVRQTIAKFAALMD
jgi:hypothetical protein